MTNSTPPRGFKQFKQGDIVDARGKIINFDAHGNPLIDFDGMCSHVYTASLTLVERPEKKYNVVLTEAQVQYLADLIDDADIPYVLGTFSAIGKAKEI